MSLGIPCKGFLIPIPFLTLLYWTRLSEIITFELWS